MSWTMESKHSGLPVWCFFRPSDLHVLHFDYVGFPRWWQKLRLTGVMTTVPRFFAEPWFGCPKLYHGDPLGEKYMTWSQLGVQAQQHTLGPGSRAAGLGPAPGP